MTIDGDSIRARQRPPLWLFALVGAAALAILVSIVVRIYSPATGLTRLIVIGSEFAPRGIAAYRATPKYIDPYPLHRFGFDGQQYAQIALDPLLRDPGLTTAIDNAPYRARRILLSWLAWLGGLGRSFWVLNAYAALNFIFWAGYAVLLAALFRPHGWAGLAGFAAMLLTCGVIESLWASLGDLPAFFLMTLAVLLGGSGGAGVLALAALTRETSLLGLVGLWDFKRPWRQALRTNLRLSLIAATPLLLWCAYVTWRLGVAVSVDGNNLDWPLRGIMAKLGEFTVTAVQGHIRWHRWYFELYKSPELHAVLTIVALLTQCVYVLTHRAWEHRLWRVAACFVPYFLCIGFLSWESHFTITRHALPITLAFNLLLAARPGRSWAAWFLLGNCFVPFGVYQFYYYLGGIRDAPPPPAEYRIVNPPPAAPAAAHISARFGAGWSPEEWNEQEGWRWAAVSVAEIVLVNTGRDSVPIGISFAARSPLSRDLRLTAGNVQLWTGRVQGSLQAVRTSPMLLPPGETTLEFRTSQAPAVSAEAGHRAVTFRLERLQIDLSPAPAAP